MFTVSTRLMKSPIVEFRVPRLDHKLNDALCFELRIGETGWRKATARPPNQQLCGTSLRASLSRALDHKGLVMGG
jgi:hypothetical protein